MKKNYLALVAGLGVWTLSACEVQVEDTAKTDKNLKTPKAYATYTGIYTGKANALSQGLGTVCDVSLQITQDTQKFEIKNLDYRCQDGTTWGFDEPVAFDLRKPVDASQLAYDLFLRGSYVGFLNYSNNYVYAGIKDTAGTVTLALSQSKKGMSLEKYTVTSNNWVLFEANPTVIKK